MRTPTTTPQGGVTTRLVTRRIKGVDVVCLVAAGTIALNGITLAAAPEAGAFANRPIYSDFYNGWCLDADIGSPTHNGTPIQLWECNGQDNQAWTWYNDGTIHSSVDGRCLDEDISQRLPNGGTWRLQLWDCNGWKNQKWTHIERGQIVSVNDSRVIQAYLSPTTPGRKIVNLNAWLDREDQEWSCNCHVPY
ncbi:ricin-type beta-trefoil lectin domain protein [Rhodococcus koreensis]